MFKKAVGCTSSFDLDYYYIWLIVFWVVKGSLISLSLRSPLLIKFCNKNFYLQHTHWIELSLIKSSSYYINTYTAAKAAISFHWIKMKELFKNCDYDYEYDLHSNYEHEVWSLVGAIQAVCIRYLHSISESTDSIRLKL